MLWAQLSGVKRGLAEEGRGCRHSARRLDLAGRGKIEEIRVELSFEPHTFFKNQAM